MDSLQETGTYITNKSDAEYAAKVKKQLSDLKSNWATAVQQSNEQKEKLAKALNDAEKLDQDIKRLVTWMKHARAGVEDDESTLQHADVTQERLDHYKVGVCYLCKFFVSYGLFEFVLQTAVVVLFEMHLISNLS